MMQQRKVYADNAATTSISPVAASAVKNAVDEIYGNPSSIYAEARAARRALDEARKKTAAAINSLPEEIYFTGGGTEADNWAVKCGFFARMDKGKHIISTKIEHPAILESLKWLNKFMGAEVTLLDVDEYGLVSIEALKEALRPDTVLVSIMMANNEIGSIQPIAEIAELLKEKNILFHTDAVQAVGHIPVDVKALGVDMLSLAGHKFHGPKGVGALYIRKGVRIPPLLHGGGHERGQRSGTENVPGIVGLGAAIDEAVNRLPETLPQMTRLRNKLIEGVLRIPSTRLTGHPEKRLPGNASFVIEYIEGESMVLMLDARGISASSGSACSSGSLDPSHVLLAIGLPHEIAHGSLRLTINENTTEEDIDYILKTLPPIVEQLRSMSPVWKG